MDRNARGQGHKHKCSPKKNKKKVFTKIFQAISTKNVFQKIFQALHKILTIQKILLSLSRGQANFRGLEASRPRPRTSKCVLEAKDVLEDSTSDFYHMLELCKLETAKNHVVIYVNCTKKSNVNIENLCKTLLFYQDLSLFSLFFRIFCKYFVDFATCILQKYIKFCFGNTDLFRKKKKNLKLIALRSRIQIVMITNHY